VAHDTLSVLLAERIRRDGASPFVTFYDLESGERTELSAVTFGNWVDKTAGFARDELDLPIGERVHIVLPLHWQTLVWWAACARAGLVITDDPTASVHVLGPEESQWDIARAQGAGQIVALSLLPWGRGFENPPPAPVVDFDHLVRRFPDTFAEPLPDSSSPVVESRSVWADQSRLIEMAQRRIADWSNTGSHRILVPDEPSASADLRDAVAGLLVAPLMASASVVIARHALRGNLSAVEAQERTTLRWSNPLT
jgi:uncharacterized protein (TIGR03089 family)